MQIGARVSFLTAALVALTVCAASMGQAQNNVAGAAVAEAERLVIHGEVVFLAIEGGFWGIVGEDGRRYDPAGLLREFQQPGLKVRVEAKAIVGRISFRQWGTPIEIERIEKSGSP